MMEFNTNYIKEFKGVIDNIVDTRINKFGMSYYLSARVSSINSDNTVNVYLLPDITNIVSNLLNKTNEVLSPGDDVEICTKNGKLSNAWVALKHGTNVLGGGSVPPGGSINQVLAKNSNSDYDFKWVNAGSGSGDMLKSTYDPNNKNADAFDMTNMIEGTLNKIFTATERTKLGGIASGAEVNVNADWNATSGDAQILNKPTIPTQLSQLIDDSTHRLVTDTEKSTWNEKQNALVSGTNIKTINSTSLLGSGNISLQTPLVSGIDYLAPNTSIIGSTKTKITYDSKGLVTSGTDATTADIIDSLNKRYVTDSQLSLLSSGLGSIFYVRTIEEFKVALESNGVSRKTIFIQWSNYDMVPDITINATGNNYIYNDFEINIAAGYTTLNIIGAGSLFFFNRFRPSNTTLNLSNNLYIYCNYFIDEDNTITVDTNSRFYYETISFNGVSQVIPINALQINWFSNNIVSPNLSTDNALVLFDGINGKKIKDSGKTISTSISNSNSIIPTSGAVYNSLSSKQDTLVSGNNIKTINSQSLLGSGDIVISGGQNVTDVTVTTANNTATKIGTTSSGSYAPILGDIIRVNFTLGCNVNNPTLNIDGSGAKNIRLGNINVTTSFVGTTSALTLMMWYDGTYYQIYGSLKNDNTTYSEISEAETLNTTSSTTRLITGRRLEYYKNNALLIDEDDMISNSATKMPSQQSVKSYVDGFANTIPVKAAGTDINTGTDDAKYVTSKAIKDSNLINSTNGTVTDIQELTMAEYEALTQEEKDNGTYFITDDQDSAINIEGTVLWTNSNNNIAFSGQAITITDMTPYSKYKIYFRHYPNYNYCVSGEYLKDWGGYISQIDEAGNRNERHWVYTNSTTLTFSGGTSNGSADTNRLIPIKIVGY